MKFIKAKIVNSNETCFVNVDRVSELEHITDKIYHIKFHGSEVVHSISSGAFASIKKRGLFGRDVEKDVKGVPETAFDSTGQSIEIDLFDTELIVTNDVNSSILKVYGVEDLVIVVRNYLDIFYTLKEATLGGLSRPKLTTCVDVNTEEYVFVNTARVSEVNHVEDDVYAVKFKGSDKEYLFKDAHSSLFHRCKKKDRVVNFDGDYLVVQKQDGSIYNLNISSIDFLAEVKSENGYLSNVKLANANKFVMLNITPTALIDELSVIYEVG